MNTGLSFDNFINLNDMPYNVRQSVRMMGFVYGGELRLVSVPGSGYNLHECVIAFVDGRVAGWVALYDSPQSVSDRPQHVGVWVQHKYRKNGIGEKLAELAYKKWAYDYQPAVFDFTANVWEGKFGYHF